MLQNHYEIDSDSEDEEENVNANKEYPLLQDIQTVGKLLFFQFRQLTNTFT